MADLEELEHEEADDSALGKDYERTSVLSAAERAALVGLQRPAANDMLEARPQPAELRDNKYVRELQPLRTYTYAAGYEAVSASTSASGNVIAVGCRNGKVLLVNPQTLELMDALTLTNATAAAAAVKFRPPTAEQAVQNVLLAALGGALLHVHASSGQILNTIKEAGNINVLQYRADGTVFAAAGTEHSVHVYDEATCRLLHSLDHGDGVSTSGHSNDVFGLAWKPDDPQVLLSGGWDHTVQVWDLRVQRSVRSIFGPYLCGDALDVQGNTILTGSWRQDTPLQLWDFNSGVLLTNLPFYQPEPDACLLYAARFGRGSMAKQLFAGGSGKQPLVRIYEEDASDGYTRLQGTFQAASAVHALDAVDSDKSHVLVVACAEQLVTLQL